MNVDENFPTPISQDLLNLVGGELLGEGLSRKVMAYRLDSKYVIKIEEDTNGLWFQNIKEWIIWQDVCEISYLKNHFAACKWISPCGRFLIQERTEPIPHSEYPEKFPHFFTDEKYQNFGVVYREGKRHFVCHDYGSLHFTDGFTKRTKKANWWE